MSAPLTLSAEFRKLVEARMNQVLQGIEETFNANNRKTKNHPKELKDELESLQETFNLLFQKWSLEILYTLMLKDAIGFGGIKKILGPLTQEPSQTNLRCFKPRLHNTKRYRWTAPAGRVRANF